MFNAVIGRSSVLISAMEVVTRFVLFQGLEI